jgi:oligoendopeptidase F
MCKAEGPARDETVAKYLELLRSGGSDHPMTLLSRAGVDFTTTEPSDALVAEMGRLVDQLEREISNLDG